MNFNLTEIENNCLNKIENNCCWLIQKLLYLPIQPYASTGVTRQNDNDNDICQAY